MEKDFELVKAIIEKALEKHPKAKRIAVENFLLSSIGYDYDNQMKNLYLDASLYRWNTQTINAIKYGLNVMAQNGLLK
jgi:hypothetical protein